MTFIIIAAPSSEETATAVALRRAKARGLKVRRIQYGTNEADAAQISE